LAVALAVALVAVVSHSTWAQAPTLSHAQPSAVAPGKATDVTLHGASLAESSAIWTDLGGQVELAPGVENNGKDAAKVVYRVTLPANAPLGIHAVRVATTKGVSNVRLLLVDDLATVADNGQNKTIPTAQEITAPVAVDGACEAESYDFYKLSGKAGQRLSVEVYARRLGTALDPVVRLLDAAGKELAYSDDEPGVGIDSRLSVKLPADGTYILEIRDIRYQGGGGHRYRLRVGDFPLVTATYPMAAKRGAAAKLVFAGPVVEGVTPADVNVAADAPEQMFLGARFPGGQSSCIVSLLTSDLDELVETEPSNSLAESTSVALPAAINGRLEQAKDIDHYKFEAKKGQRFIFQGQTRSLGSPTDLFLRVLKADGAKLAEAEDTGPEEGALDFTAPDDGVYHLVVEDLLRRGGPQHAYRIEARAFQAGFKLNLDVEKLDVPLGGVFAAKVTAARNGYNGPIELSLDGVEGCTLAGNVIAEGKPETTMLVTVPASVAQGSLRSIAVVGKAKIGEAEFAARAASLTPVRAAFSGLPYPPLAAYGRVGLGVGAAFPDFFKIALEQPKVEFPRLIAAGSFTVKAERMNNFDDVVNLAVEGLPAGFTATVEPIAKGKPNATIKLAGPADAAEGQHKFTIKGSATFQNQPRSFALGEVVLEVVKPLSVSLVPAGPIAPGGKQKVKIAVNRYGEKGEIALELKNLPTGVKPPENLKLGVEQNEIEIELEAAADTAQGKTENVQVVAKAKVKDQEVTAESAPAVLEVKAG
jgi:hypothetical protein